MNQRRFEIFIAIILAVISYYGDYYLKEPLIAGIAKHTFTWQVLNIGWLLTMVFVGYWGLYNHEVKWIKSIWLIVNFLFLGLLLINKIAQHYKHPFLPDSTSNILKTPFLFLTAAFFPRWLNKGNRISKEK